MYKKLWVENIDHPAVKYQQDSPGEDWLDKSTDAISWDLYGGYVLDYLMYRDKINEILFIKANPNYPTIDFSGFFSVLTGQERFLMCKYVLAPYALRLMVVSEEEDYYHWEQLVRITKGNELLEYPYTGRALVVEKMRRYVAHLVRKELMTMTDSQQFFEDVFTLVELYIASANPKFKQWLTNMVGTPYENDGFEQKPYWTQDLEDNLMIIYNGND